MIKDKLKLRIKVHKEVITSFIHVESGNESLKTRNWEGFRGKDRYLCTCGFIFLTVFFINIISPEGVSNLVLIVINVKGVCSGSSLIVEIGTLSHGLVYCTFFFN